MKRGGSGWSFTASRQVSRNKKEDSPAALVCIVAILFDTAFALLTLSAALHSVAVLKPDTAVLIAVAVVVTGHECGGCGRPVVSCRLVGHCAQDRRAVLAWLREHLQGRG